VNLRVLTQFFVGMYLNNPHNAHRHESVLLKDFGNDIFQDGHSRLPYYVTSLAFLKLEKYLREQKIPSYIKSYKPHILMMLREGIAGYVPSFYKEKTIDAHSQQILDILIDDNKALEKFKEVITVFDKAMITWETELGKTRRGTKDVEAFTKHLLENTRKYFKTISVQDTEDTTKLYSGRVVNLITDKFGNQCGFIERQPENIFFHSSNNKNLNFHFLKGKWVTYKVERNIKTNRDFAIDVELVK